MGTSTIIREGRQTLGGAQSRTERGGDGNGCRGSASKDCHLRGGRKDGASEEGQLEYDLRSLGSNHASKSAGEGRGERDDDDNDAGRKGCSDDF